MKLKIRTKLLGSAGILLVFTALVGVLGIINLGSVDALIDERSALADAA